MDSYAFEQRGTHENAGDGPVVTLRRNPARVNTGERLQTGGNIHGVQVVARSDRAGPTNILGFSFVEGPIFWALEQQEFRPNRDYRISTSRERSSPQWATPRCASSRRAV